MTLRTSERGKAHVMLTGIVLLYVGAALLVNGIWLIGQARTADMATREPAPQMAGARLGAESSRQDEAGRGTDRAGHLAQSRRMDVESHLGFLQGREVAVINIFTGGIGVAVAILLVVLGGINGVRSNVADAAFILLFAFTYLWIAANQFLDAGSRAFGWFCFFVAVTAVPTASMPCATHRGTSPQPGWQSTGSYGRCCGSCSFCCSRSNGPSCDRSVGQPSRSR